MSRIDDAIQRVYDSDSVRDELTDEEAGSLLKWAEREIGRLDAVFPSDAAFNQQIDTLLDLLTSMNRFAGKQGQISAQAASDVSASIATQAASLGHATNQAQINAAATGDPTSTVAALIGLMRTSAPISGDPHG